MFRHLFSVGICCCSWSMLFYSKCAMSRRLFCNYRKLIHAKLKMLYLPTESTNVQLYTLALF